MIVKHQLIIDFPEFENKIHQLKIEDAHFKKLFEEYDAVDHQIYRIETDAEPASDDVLNSLRMERVHKKDEIYSYLHKN
ncbi:YdcH family protein [Flavobacterium sp. J27]|uniref:YdcH family protein n=1 Tax=Flavobacterium sp. J27 TaxID=2060419 RepID=UPI001030E99D|nr:YdcH family protein [Flavobacterium sp. J27]